MNRTRPGWDAGRAREPGWMGGAAAKPPHVAAYAVTSPANHSIACAVLSAALGVAMCVALGTGCTTPAQREPAPTPQPQGAERTPGRTSPALADELRSHGAREARSLESRVRGLRLEPVDHGGAPHWWPDATQDATRAVGTGAAPSLEAAYEQAMGRARATASVRLQSESGLRPERAAWLRLPDGRFHVWVVVGDGTTPLETPPPVELPGDGP
jgi:hypothetical protein